MIHHETANLDMKTSGPEHVASVRMEACTVAPIAGPCTLSRTPPSEWQHLLDETALEKDPANFYMRLYYQMLGLCNRELALTFFKKALSFRNTYRLSAPLRPRLRLLALMGPGDMQENTPLDFLLEGSNIELILLFVLPDRPLPECVPEHEVAIVALAESSSGEPVLRQIQLLTRNWPRPVLNRPESILRCARDQLYERLNNIPGMVVARTQRIKRSEIVTPTTPITLRPLDSQAGQGLVKVASHEELELYLQSQSAIVFYQSDYIETAFGDGLYRKYRIALVAGQPFACHAAISQGWIVHYLSAEMEQSIAKRSEEAAFLQGFEQGFGRRHSLALAEIALRLDLDYVVIDCSETSDGKLVLFEADNRSWVHATDPIEIFPYKPAVMQKVFDAFATLLERTALGCG